MMNTLQRTSKQASGIISLFTFDGDLAQFMVCLEHAYLQDDGVSYDAILQPGTYTCVLGTHELEDGVQFQTYEITGVTDADGNAHTGILFHVGNFNRDSKGCVLCGQTQTTYDAAGDEMITGSKVEFAAFMARLGGVASFPLQVI